MSRKLILTPYEHGFIAGANYALNEGPLAIKDDPLDLTHIILSVVTMAGVDSIHSIGNMNDTNTKLVKKILSEKSTVKWAICHDKISTIFNSYKNEASTKDEKDSLNSFSHFVTSLFYGMETNSGILLLSDPSKELKKDLLPLEIRLPSEVLINSIQERKRFFLS
ncbi:MAG: hypothetical protein WC756_19485 [Taibaiella sp.]|jgi:hypothetical protein